MNKDETHWCSSTTLNRVVGKADQRTSISYKGSWYWVARRSATEHEQVALGARRKYMFKLIRQGQPFTEFCRRLVHENNTVLRYRRGSDD